MQFWNELEGQRIEGLYPLHRLVRAEGRTAWFDTTIGDNSDQPATISLTESLTDTDEVLERLLAAQQLKHPNLVEIAKIGQTRVEGTPVVYAIMEHTDQNLSDVLSDQALSKEEARQVAEAVVAALSAIHQKGLVHGRVEAGSVFAVGESVKLRSDCMQSPGASRAGDIAGVGAIVFQAFTQQRVPAADDPQINRIPAPFSEIVRNSLNARWNLAQIASVLKPPTAATPTMAPAPARAGSTPHVAPKTPAAEVRQPATTQPAAAAKSAVPAAFKPAVKETPPPVKDNTLAPAKIPPQNPVVRQFQDAPRSQAAQPSDALPEAAPKKPIALYAAIALAVLLVLGWLIFRPKQNAPAVSNAVPATSPQSPATTPSVPPPAPAPTGKTSAVRSSAPPTAQPTATNAEGRSVWRVVAYTYNRQQQAQHKVEEIAREHSDLQVSVFAPHGNHAPYLVTIGGPMDRNHAFAVRDQARRMGLPSDTYAQNFSE